MTTKTTARSRRPKVLLTGTSVIDGRHAQVKIRDVSEQGAMMECAAAPTPRVGQRGILTRGGSELEFSVVWSQGRRYGVSFDEPVSCADMLNHIRRPAATATPQPPVHRRPGLTRHQPDPRVKPTRTDWTMPAAYDRPGE